MRYDLPRPSVNGLLNLSANMQGTRRREVPVIGSWQETQTGTSRLVNNAGETCNSDRCEDAAKKGMH